MENPPALPLPPGLMASSGYAKLCSGACHVRFHFYNDSPFRFCSLSAFAEHVN